MAFTNLTSLISSVCDEEAAVSFLKMKNIIPLEKKCENGHQTKLSFSGYGPTWQCDKQTCRTSRGAREGTWLEKSTIPLHKAVYIIYCWAQEQNSVKFCIEKLDISKPTIVDFKNYLREVCVWRIEQKDAMIGGEGLIVEIDECILKKNDDARTKLAQQRLFGGICRETKDCFIVKVSDRSVETLMPIIRQRIRPGSIIVSDRWKAYRDILMNDFKHETINDQLNFVDPVEFANTRPIEKTWDFLEWEHKWRPETNGKYMDLYLAEFIWRMKLNGRSPFETILQDMSLFYNKTLEYGILKDQERKEIENKDIVLLRNEPEECVPCDFSVDNEKESIEEEIPIKIENNFSEIKKELIENLDEIPEDNTDSSTKLISVHSENKLHENGTDKHVKEKLHTMSTEFEDNFVEIKKELIEENLNESPEVKPDCSIKIIGVHSENKLHENRTDKHDKEKPHIIPCKKIKLENENPLAFSTSTVPQTISNSCEDEFSHFCKRIEDRLRRLPKMNVKACQSKINNIFLQEEMKFANQN